MAKKKYHHSSEGSSGYFYDQYMWREIQNPQMFETDPALGYDHVVLLLVLLVLVFSTSTSWPSSSRVQTIRGRGG
jgi:hypothetical protein